MSTMLLKFLTSTTQSHSRPDFDNPQVHLMKVRPWHELALSTGSLTARLLPHTLIRYDRES